MRKKTLSKLGKLNDIGDFVLQGGGAASESEIENTIEAPSLDGGKVGIRLSELGPRMTLQLVKVVEGVLVGTVVYHRTATTLPTEEDIKKAKAKQKLLLRQRNEMLSRTVGKVKAKRSAARRRKMDNRHVSATTE